MSDRFLLFVYGQLMRGEIGYKRLDLERRTEWLGDVRIRGTLYDFGDYPGLVAGGRGTVHGELLAFDDPALWTALDEYEDCDPGNPDLSEYQREQVELVDGGRAWTYVYARPVENHPVIATGSWS